MRFIIFLFTNLASVCSWEWLDEWEVDLSQSFGKTDAEGWVYGSSFDSVNRSILKADTIPVPGNTALCRKRRWCRVMITRSPVTSQAVTDRIAQIISERKRIGANMIEKQGRMQLECECIVYQWYSTKTSVL